MTINYNNKGRSQTLAKTIQPRNAFYLVEISFPHPWDFFLCGKVIIIIIVSGRATFQTNFFFFLQAPMLKQLGKS